MKLSICMMVKNEEKNLHRCLEKLKPLTESGLGELIIIDTGSEDSSVSIAKQYTDKVYFHKWNKNFSDMRNISISYAKGEWIFIIDADERLDDVEKLITLMNSSEIKKFNAILIQVKNLYYVNDEDKYNLIVSPRLFRNDGKFRYEGSVHNQPIFNGPNLNVDISLTHFGYISNDKELMELKYNRTTELLKAELEKDPENIYYRYQLGVSYDMHGNYVEALEEFREAYSSLNKRSLEERKIYVYVYASYSRIAYTNGRLKDTIKIAKEALEFEKDYIDLYYLIGISEMQLKNNEEAFKYLNKYLELIPIYNELEISKDMSIIMYHVDDKSKSTACFQIIKYYLDLDQYKDAYKVYNNITNINEKIYASINILIPLEKYSELREVYYSIISERDRNNFLCTLEEKIKKIEDTQKNKCHQEFALDEELYGLLNKVRISSDINEKIRLSKLLMNEIDFDKNPIFYSEIFENIKDDIKLIISVFRRIEIYKLRGIVKYLIEQKGFAEIFECYILNNGKNIENIEETKVLITIANMLMLLYINNNNKVSEKYLNVFKVYLNLGINFVQELYKVERAEEIYKIVNDQEDRFLIIMYICDDLIKKNNKKAAIKYMIKAVNTYEAFAKYIDEYKNEVLNLEVKEKNDEFEQYKLKVKENINNLVNNGLLEEARLLISEYEELVKYDMEIYSVKAVIYIIENRLDEAESVLKEGLKIDEKNYDLMYNLAYIYEIKQNYIEALTFYRKALRSNYYDIDRTEIENKIQELKILIKNTVNDQISLNLSKIDNILFVDFDNNEKVNKLAKKLADYGLNIDIAYAGDNPLSKLSNAVNPYRKILGVTNIDDFIEYAKYYNYDAIHLFNISNEVKKYFKGKLLGFVDANIFDKTDDEVIEYYANNKLKPYSQHKHVETNKITIIVPTYNRPYYLNRTLNFISNYKYIKPKVIVLDSSEDSKKIENEKNVHKFQNSNIIYKQYSSKISPGEKISFGLLSEEVNTEYTALCFDDDFLAEEGIIESINILDRDKELFSAKGKNLYFSNTMENLIEYDWFEGLEQNNEMDRLKEITKGFVGNFAFLVFRTDKYKKLQKFYDDNKEELPKNPTFIEYLYHFLKIATGKIAKINVDLNIRDQSIQREQYAENFPHTVMDGNFNDEYTLFCKILKKYFDYLEKDVQNFDNQIEVIFIDFLVNFLRVPKQFIEIKDNKFNITKLEVGMRKSWVWPSNL